MKNWLNKVAEVTLIFWLAKIVATTLGETLWDYISQTLNLGYYIGITLTGIVFLFVLGLQLFSKKYTPWIFWLVIIGTTTFGTEISDFMDRTLWLGYTNGSMILIWALCFILFLSWKRHRHLEVYPIYERTQEIYFWIAVLLSNSLWTAFGDFLSDSLGLGYLEGAFVTSGVIFVVVLLHYFGKNLNQAFLFWIAFIFTRPFGATFGDLLTKPLEKWWLDLWTLNASLVSVVLMVVLIITMTLFQSKSEKSTTSIS